MRVVSDDLDAEVAGTTTGDRLEVHAWRGGILVAPDLLVSSWSVSWSADRQVQGMASLTIADPDGDLAPWAMSDPLAPGGSRAQLTWVSGTSGLRVPWGWWRLRTADPAETWRIYRTGGQVLRVAGGGSVTITADEETATADLERLDAEVVTEAMCLAEITRLLDGICPVVVDPGVVDRAVPGDLVYGDGRMDAVEDLLQVLDAAHRMGPDGSFEVVPVAGVGPVWTVEGGDEGVLVHLGRHLSDAGVVNAARSTGQDPTGGPLVARAFLSAGPLAWGGPFGKVPVFHRSIATTQAGVAADAATVLANRVGAGEVDLPVETLMHPGVQLQDRVVVVASTGVGQQPLEGRVVAMSARSVTTGQGTVPSKRMSLTVRVSVEALEAVGRRVRRARG